MTIQNDLIFHWHLSYWKSCYNLLNFSLLVQGAQYKNSFNGIYFISYFLETMDRQMQSHFTATLSHSFSMPSLAEGSEPISEVEEINEVKLISAILLTLTPQPLTLTGWYPIAFTI